MRWYGIEGKLLVCCSLRAAPSPYILGFDLVHLYPSPTVWSILSRKDSVESLHEADWSKCVCYNTCCFLFPHFSLMTVIRMKRWLRQSLGRNLLLILPIGNSGMKVYTWRINISPTKTHLRHTTQMHTPHAFPSHGKRELREFCVWERERIRNIMRECV